FPPAGGYQLGAALAGLRPRNHTPPGRGPASPPARSPGPVGRARAAAATGADPPRGGHRPGPQPRRPDPPHRPRPPPGPAPGTPATLTSAVWTIAPSTDGKTFFVFNKREAHYLDAATGQPLPQKRGTFSPGVLSDSFIVSGSANGKTSVLLMPVHDVKARTILGTFVASVTTEAAPGKQQTIQLKTAIPSPAQVARADGQFFFLSAWPEGLRVRSARTGAPVGPPLPDSWLIQKAVFHPNGRALLTATKQHIARLWNLADGKPLGP